MDRIWGVRSEELCEKKDPSERHPEATRPNPSRAWWEEWRRAERRVTVALDKERSTRGSEGEIESDGSELMRHSAEQSILQREGDRVEVVQVRLSLSYAVSCLAKGSKPDTRVSGRKRRGRSVESTRIARTNPALPPAHIRSERSFKLAALRSCPLDESLSPRSSSQPVLSTFGSLSSTLP